MPDLRDMLHDAAPPVAPTFDAGDVAGRVRATDRRRRLTGAGLMAAVVVLVGLVVGTGLGSRETSLIDTPPSTAPAPPGGTRAWLAAVLVDVGAEVLPTEGASTVAEVHVTAGGTTVVVRAGDPAEIGLPDGVVGVPGEAIAFTGGSSPPTSSFHPVGGAVTGCLQQVAAFAGDEPGLDHALALIEAIAASPLCPATFDSPAPTRTPHPVVVPDHGQQVVAALRSAGLVVEDVEVNGPGVSLRFLPSQAGSSPVWVELAGPEAPTPVVDADTEIVPLAGGEGVVLPGAGLISFTCPDIGLVTTSGPASGGSELAWVEQLPQALACTPRPHGLTGPRYQSIREARLARALDALGMETCCGEPSHGGSGAATGMVWEDVPVAITAGPLIFTDPATQPGTDVVDLAGGQADRQNADVGNPVLRFDCGDTGYEMVEFLRNAADDRAVIAAAEALVDQLGCTPSIGQG